MTMLDTNVSIAELLFGIARLPGSAYKQTFAHAAQNIREKDFANSVVAFDLEASILLT